MKRRTFLKNAIVAGVASNLLPVKNLFAADQGFPDLVIAKGHAPSVLLQLSLKAIGGLSQFEIKGKRVLIKPTIQWNTRPLEGKNTDPNLIYHLIRHCYDAGAWEVYILDHTIDDWRLCYMNSGIEKASKEAFGKIVPANEPHLYKNDKAGFLVHRLVHKCDLIINVPKLNDDPAAGLFGALKNLQGLTWENGNFDAVQKDNKLIALLKDIKPVLTVMDAFGTKTSEKEEGTLICGRNSLAVDVTACKLFDKDPSSVSYLKLATEMGEGELNSANLIIQKIYT